MTRVLTLGATLDQLVFDGDTVAAGRVRRRRRPAGSHEVGGPLVRRGADGFEVTKALLAPLSQEPPLQLQGFNRNPAQPLSMG